MKKQWHMHNNGALDWEKSRTNCHDLYLMSLAKSVEGPPKKTLGLILYFAPSMRDGVQDKRREIQLMMGKT